MRSETRKYICAELLNYKRSKNELQRVREQLEYIRQYPAFNKDYTVERLMYLQERESFLRRITDAINVAVSEMDEEEKKVLRLKFWSPKPRPTDNMIAREMGMSLPTLYRTINGICKKICMRLGADI
ncbi:MAG: hypothetical protein ACI3WS_02700 [Phascolarctobacterium sp.]